MSIVKHRSNPALIFFIICAITGCRFNTVNSIELTGNPERDKKIITGILPSGSSAAKAKLEMEKNGFACELMKNSSFSENGKMIKNIDFIYCNREAGFPVARRWQIAIVHKKNIVRDIYVSTGLAGF